MTELNKTITAPGFIHLLKSHLPKLLKFGVIGVSAAVLDFGIFALLLRTLAPSQIAFANNLEFSPVTIANTAGILTGFFWSFFLQKYWAFKAAGKAWAQFIATAFLLGFNILITSFAIPLISINASVSLEVAKVFMQVAVVAWNYLLYNYFIFKQLGDKE